MHYSKNKHVLAITGGVGGTKLVLGLAQILDESELTVVVNTADDFEHLGLYICPDLDTVTYTLADLNDKEKGWGRADESWNFMHTLRTFDKEHSWFNLGDHDLVTHVYRTDRLRAGATLQEVTKDIANRLGTNINILPMTNDKVSTLIDTDDEPLCFQDYFVKLQCKPKVTKIRYSGTEKASPVKEFITALQRTDLEAVIICPSNPYLSIDPILAMPEVIKTLQECAAPVIAVSPIVDGLAIKGPTAKIMSELKIDCSAYSVAQHYQDFIDGFVLDSKDTSIASDITASGLEVLTKNTIMQTLQDKQTLAESVLNFASHLSTQVEASV